MPNATRLPRTRKGGESEAFRLRNPIIVVAVVRNTGQALSRSDWTTAASLSRPWLIPDMIVSTTWTECAMATVMMIGGMPELAELSTRPAQPMTPMVEPRTKMSTRTRDSVPSRERSRMAATDTTTRNAVGPRICISSSSAFDMALVHEDVAGQVIADVRMVRPDLVQESVDIVGRSGSPRRTRVLVG